MSSVVEQSNGWPNMDGVGLDPAGIQSGTSLNKAGNLTQVNENGLDVSIHVPDTDSLKSPVVRSPTPEKEVLINGNTTTNYSSVLNRNGFDRGGQDFVLPSDNLWTWTRDEPVKLRIDSKGYPPMTVMTAFRNTAQQFANHNALAAKINGCWKTWTYTEYYNDVWRAAKALLSLGLQRYNGVGIIGFNSPEWFIADLAAIFAGGFATGIYATSSPDACRFVADNAKCNVIFVENDNQLQKIFKVQSNLPNLKAIVQYKGQPSGVHPNVYSWEEFMRFADQTSDAMLQRFVDEQAVNQCCSLIYTSGTTGNPKGVMLSHDNLIWTAKHAIGDIGMSNGSDVLVSYLPLSHVAAQILDIFMPLVIPVTVYFAQPDALKNSLVDTLREVRPTVFFGVPRIWEKMQEKMTSVGSRQSNVKKVIARLAKAIGLRGSLAKMNGGALPYGWSLANQMVFKKVKDALGFGRCQLFFTAAAPITRDTLEFFMSLDISVLEHFGLSETSGPHTMSSPSKFRITSVGSVNRDSPVTILNKDAEGNGEIALSGRNVFMGYLNEQEKTEETFTPDGYLRSGDIGYLDDDGFLYISGRIKELIITAGGENVAPVPIEEAVKSALPESVSNCMLVGDKRKFLSMLITLKTEFDPITSEPTDRISHSTLEWSRGIGSSSKTVSEIIASAGKDPILAAIQAGIDEANKKSVSRAQFVQKWSLIQKDFSIAGGELGPTLKLKRHVVLKMYEDVIEAFYTVKS